ncbi:MAG: hypothetical protein K9J17_08570 [Flavobacteriales bacterium]|nr:hypothetical protein [Flavobacteriales bacterium]
MDVLLPTMSFYLDTSAFNCLVDKFSGAKEAFATREHLRKSNKIWIVSPLNFYEIFSNSDPHRREILIARLSQLLPSPGMIYSSPTRILLGQVLNFHHPLTEYEDNINQAWFSIVKDDRKTFIYDFDVWLERTRYQNSLHKVIKWIGCNYELTSTDGTTEDIALSIYAAIKTVNPSDFFLQQKHGEKLFYLKVLVIFCVFCLGVEPENKLLETFWNRHAPSLNTFERLHHVFEKYPDELFTSDEIDLMAHFLLYHQVEHVKKVDRGTFRDALHLLYSQHAYNFVTSDGALYDFVRTNRHSALVGVTAFHGRDFYFVN